MSEVDNVKRENIFGYLFEKRSLTATYAEIACHFKDYSPNVVSWALATLVGQGRVTEYPFSGRYEVSEAGYKQASDTTRPRAQDAG